MAPWLCKKADSWNEAPPKELLLPQEAAEDFRGGGAVGVGLHGPTGSTLAEAADFFGVVESFGEGNQGFDNVPFAAVVELGDFGAAGVQVGCHCAQVLFRDHDLQVHDRLEKLGVVPERLIDSVGARGLES